MKPKIFAPIDPEDLELLLKNSAIPLSKPRVLCSELMGMSREVIIEHAGEEYRLRLTRRDKLILTK